MLNTLMTEPKKLISAPGIRLLHVILPERRDEAILFCPLTNLPATSVTLLVFHKQEGRLMFF